MKLAEVQQVCNSCRAKSVPVRELGPILEVVAIMPANQDPMSRSADTSATGRPHHLHPLPRRQGAPAVPPRRTLLIRRWRTASAPGFDHNEHGLFIRMSPQAVESLCRLIAAEAEAGHGWASAGAVGQPADPRRREADDRPAYSAVGRVKLQRNHARYEDRLIGNGEREK